MSANLWILAFTGMTWGEIGNDGQKIGGDSAIIVHFNQGNRILLSESEYRSQILQVPARSLPLRRHAYFQRLFSFLTAYLHYALRGEIGKLGGAPRQNQDLRDYRIFRILPAPVRIRLGAIYRYGEKRNPGEEKSCKS